MATDIKTAIRTALDFVSEVYADDEHELKDLSVEEIELNDDGTRWIAIVGAGGQERASTMSVVAGEGTPRQYKRLEIDVATGAVLSMKTWTRR